MTGTINNKARKNNYQRMYMRLRYQTQQGVTKEQQFEQEKERMNEDLRKISWQEMLYFVSYFFPKEKNFFKRERKEGKAFRPLRFMFKQMYLDRKAV